MDPVLTADGSVFNVIGGKSKETLRRFRNQIAEKGSAAIFVILALITIAVLIAFLIMKMKAVNTNGALIVGDTLKLYNMTSQARVDQGGIPPTVNGQEYSFSLWLYLADFQPTQDYPQLIFMRGTDSTSVGTANPIVALDGYTNRLYVSVRTNASKTVTSTNFFKQDQSNYLTASIDYFPLQRWVNLIIIVKDDTLSLYFNGALYTVASVTDIMKGASRPVFSACTGAVVVGPSGVSEVREPRGYIAQFRFFNYALTSREINSIYGSGPNSTSIFSRLGIAGYGLRSPVYRVE